MVAVFHGVLGGGVFLCGNGAKRGDHCVVDGAAVKEENAEYFLY